MKKYKLVLFSFIFIFSLLNLNYANAATTPTPNCTINNTLRLGSKGDEVACVQKQLGLSADGKFGPKTKAAVIQFQISNKLTGDGIVGPKSRVFFNTHAVSIYTGERTPNSTAKITISAPTLTAPLTSQISHTINPQWTYTGTLAVRFALLEGPSGMTIDFTTGGLTWIPPKSAEGTSPNVHISATDGEAFGDITFKLPIATSKPIMTTINGSKITITEPGSLNGLTINLPSKMVTSSGGLTIVRTPIVPKDVKISSVDITQAPPVPSHILRLTDFFRTTPLESTESDAISFNINTKILPAGGSFDRITLYAYTEGATDTFGPIWSSSQLDFDMISPTVVKINTYMLGELMFIGIPKR
ncbi:MAG: peptidoglycan-binding domain-containing protein [Candidatus Paceibacterota bacterium]|jgi:peptidoglycan hydrolase-like protein with peptidoglycan-binding domain